jgi:hypothetical protein
MIVIALTVPFYQALVFNLNVDGALLLTIALSFFTSLIYYFVAYGGVVFMARLSKKLYKTNIDSILFISQVFLIAVFFISYIEALLLPDWKTYDSLINIHLACLAVYFAVGNYSYNRKLLPLYQPTLMVDGEKCTKSEIVRGGLTLLLTVGILFGLQLQKASGLKSDLYELSVVTLKTSQNVSAVLGQKLVFSMFIRGEIGTEHGHLRYNLTGKNQTSMVNVVGQLVDGKWEIVKLTLSNAKAIMPIIVPQKAI